MQTLKIIALVVVAAYVSVGVLLYFLQSRLIFYPARLPGDFRFSADHHAEEVFVRTGDGETIHGLFYPGGDEVILYFHGNAGDLSGWQFVTEDFTALGYSVLIIDYRGYGKSSGSVSEEGLYLDADAAWNFLVAEKGFSPEDIIIYGRSIGTGVAVELATRHSCKGLVLESAYTSLAALANEKFPMFFPGLYLRFGFNNLDKIGRINCPVIMLHGSDDTLIPPQHTRKLFEKATGKKKMILFENGGHNDLSSFREHRYFLEEVLPVFFKEMK